MMRATTIRAKLKDLVSQQVYSKKWDELSTLQQNELRSKHKQQFDTLSRRARKEMGEATTQSVNDHDLLIRIDERTTRIEKWCFNHDVHHFRYTMLAWSVALGAIVTLAIALIKVL